MHDIRCTVRLERPVSGRKIAEALKSIRPSDDYAKAAAAYHEEPVPEAEIAKLREYQASADSLIRILKIKKIKEYEIPKDGMVRIGISSAHPEWNMVVRTGKSLGNPNVFLDELYGHSGYAAMSGEKSRLSCVQKMKSEELSNTSEMKLRGSSEQRLPNKILLISRLTGPRIPA